MSHFVGNDCISKIRKIKIKMKIMEEKKLRILILLLDCVLLLKLHVFSLCLNKKNDTKLEIS